MIGGEAIPGLTCRVHKPAGGFADRTFDARVEL